MTRTMNRIAASAVAAFALGLASAGVYAAQPVAGDMPIVSVAVAPSAQHSHFDVLGTRAMPASGQLDTVTRTAWQSTLTRAQVEDRALKAGLEYNGFPDASGQVSM